MEPLICPECGSEMILRRSNKYKYPDGTFRLFFQCKKYPDCKAIHGAKQDGTPLGIPGDEKTRKARIKAHQAFDRFWNYKKMTRTEGYLWLQKQLKYENAPHIGLMDVEECQKVVAICQLHKRDKK